MISILDTPRLLQLQLTVIHTHTHTHMYTHKKYSLGNWMPPELMMLCKCSERN